MRLIHSVTGKRIRGALVKIMEQGNEWVLEHLQGRQVGKCIIHLGEVKQLRMSGWRGFTLFLKDSSGEILRFPVIKGIFSRGGKDGVKPWMDIGYWSGESTGARDKKKGACSVTPGHEGQDIFQVLGSVIPPGGHVMVSYEEGEEIHTNTMKSLAIGVPPVLTPLGYLIFKAGFQHIKDWYLAEGGFEGPRKLWGEKAYDEGWERVFFEKTAREIDAFHRNGLFPDLCYLREAAVQRAREVQRIMGKN